MRDNFTVYCYFTNLKNHSRFAIMVKTPYRWDKFNGISARELLPKLNNIRGKHADNRLLNENIQSLIDGCNEVDGDSIFFCDGFESYERNGKAY